MFLLKNVASCASARFVGGALSHALLRLPSGGPYSRLLGTRRMPFGKQIAQPITVASMRLLVATLCHVRSCRHRNGTTYVPAISLPVSDTSFIDKLSPWSPGKNASTTSIMKERRRPISRCRFFAKITLRFSTTAGGAVRSIDLTKTRVSGGLTPDLVTDGRKRAMEQPRTAEERVARRYGTEGLGLTRAVLVKRQSVEQTARLRGAESDREVWFWTKLFRRCLDVLAAAFGFSTSAYRPW